MDEIRDDRHRNRKVYGDAMKIGPYHESQVPGRPGQAPSGQPGKTQEAGDLEKSPAQSRSSADQARSRQDNVQLSGAGGAVDPEPCGRIGYDRERLRDRRVAHRATDGYRVEAAQNDSGGRQLDKARLETIRHRMESGFYEQPDVREKIADRLAEKLTDIGEEQGDSEYNHGYGDNRQ